MKALPISLSSAYRLGALTRTKGKKSLVKKGKSLEGSTATQHMEKLKALRGGK